MQYRDFNVRIEGKVGDAYRVSVSSPAGDGGSEMRLTHSTETLLSMLVSLGQEVRSGGTPGSAAASRGRAPTSPSTAPPSLAATEIGGALFDDLFTGNVRSLFDESLGMVSGGDHGLRIKLRVDPADPELADLAGMPWELLYRKEKREYLNLSRSTPLVRYLEVQSPTEPPPFEPPLKVLVVVSDPQGVAELDLDKERQLIEESWGGHEAVQVDFLEQATPSALNRRLTSRPYHVLHYMGHGDFDAESGRGVLVMEDDDGNKVDLDGTTLGVVLRDIASLQLVFLNACKTAQLAPDAGKDPFAGTASSLVMAGVPAVVAMQFPISDPAAIAFAGSFYPKLADGYPVDAAVAEGRKEIRIAQPASLEWATPVLFMRSRDGVLFDLGETVAEALPPQPVSEDAENQKREAVVEKQASIWRRIDFRIAAAFILLAVALAIPVQAGQALTCAAAAALFGWSVAAASDRSFTGLWPAWTGLGLAVALLVLALAL